MNDAQQKWIKKMQKLLNQAPPGLGFYTTGDPSIVVYDGSKDDEIGRLQDEVGGEFGNAVEKLDCEIGLLRFPAAIHSTAG